MSNLHAEYMEFMSGWTPPSLVGDCWQWCNPGLHTGPLVCTGLQEEGFVTRPRSSERTAGERPERTCGSFV